LIEALFSNAVFSTTFDACKIAIIVKFAQTGPSAPTLDSVLENVPMPDTTIVTPAFTEMTSFLAETGGPPCRFPKVISRIFGFRALFRPGLMLWLVTAIVGAVSTHAGETRALRGHVPPAAALSRPVGPLSGTNWLHLAIGLPFRNRESLTNLLKDLYDPASPSFHQFLNPGQFTAAYGPTETDYQAVIAFAKSSGLTIMATSSNRALLEVGGRAADIEKAFHVNLRLFQHPRETRTFYAPDVEPSLDSDIPVLFIAGLSSYQIPHPASLHATRLTGGRNPTPDTGTGSLYGYYGGPDFRSAYAPGVTNTGTGQSIGLVEFDSYYSTDITDYLKLPQTGLSNSSVTLSNVVLGLTGSPGSGNVEVALDIDMAISMAPGLATIYVYEGTNDSAAPDVVLNRILSDNLSRQLSCSWSGFDDSTVEQDLQEFGAQGQSFFVASGDSGAYLPTYNPVSPPCDNPNITVVGGTTLTTTGAAGSWVSETTWNWFTQPFSGLSNSATSGGVSPTWSLPAWQKGISMKANQGSTNYRNLPDVALVANNLFLYANDGGEYSAGGTSAAAPLWAGLAALINQQRTNQAQPPEGFMNPALYAIGKGALSSSCFHDITVGNNTNYGTYVVYTRNGYYYANFVNPTQFFAVSGYDLCTGWGTPIGAGLMGALAPEPCQITPSTGFASSGFYGGPFSVTSETFTLTNVATAPFNWSVAVSSPWLSASSSGGALASGGAAAVVSLGLNTAASNLTVGAYTNSVWFTNLNDSVAQKLQFTLTVTKAAPQVTWNTPAAVVYGTALSSTQLDAMTSVMGGFAYIPTNGSVLYAGTHALTAVFTPSDTTDYSKATNTVSLVVQPASLTVSAASATRPFGQPNPVFQGTLTGLENGDNITASYSCAATPSSPVGAYPIIPSLNDPANLQTNYTISTNDGTLTVTQAAPAVAWATPAAISYGTALGSTQLDAMTSVMGGFAYIPTNGSVLYAGTNTLTAVFTPTDTNDYSNATNTVSLVVQPAPLTVSAASATRPFGQPNPVFQGTLTGLENGDNITASYSCAATLDSPVGTYPIIPSLNDPSDFETNYIVSTNDGTLTVTQAAPAITWATPAPIPYGTALSSNQLDATASVPGSFDYNPAAGTVLDAGTDMLSVIFTPTNTLDYSSATDTVSLVVTAPELGDTGGDTPLMPFWGGMGLLAGLAVFGAGFLARRKTPAG
jgi:subtilase family serine protease